MEVKEHEATEQDEGPSGNGHRPRGPASGIDWTPPRTREEAEAAIVSLSNDVGLILAQLSEDQTAWCQRTGRSAFDYAAWRRRALFAKVHKEHQLRECKRIRFQPVGAAELEADRGEHAADQALLDLAGECNQVLAVWQRIPRGHCDAELDAALARLASYLHVGRGDHSQMELVGAVEPDELAG